MSQVRQLKRRAFFSLLAAPFCAPFIPVAFERSIVPTGPTAPGESITTAVSRDLVVRLRVDTEEFHRQIKAVQAQYVKLASTMNHPLHIDAELFVRPLAKDMGRHVRNDEGSLKEMKRLAWSLPAAINRRRNYSR
jgi:hypothetical protein